MTWVLRLWLGPTPPYLSHGILQRWAGLPPGARRGELTVPVHHWACHEAGEGVSPPLGVAGELPFTGLVVLTWSLESSGASS